MEIAPGTRCGLPELGGSRFADQVVELKKEYPMRAGRRVGKMVAVAATLWACVLAGTSHAGPPVPEIDPSSFGSVLALAIGALAMLERRRFM